MVRQSGRQLRHLFVSRRFIALNWNYWSPQMMTVGFSIVAVACAAVLFLSITTDSSIKRLLTIAPLGWLGRRAYFLYLLHPVFPTMVFRIAGKDRGLLSPRQWILFWFSLTAMFVAAELSWRFFEKPLIQIGHPFHYGRSATSDKTLAGQAIAIS